MSVCVSVRVRAWARGQDEGFVPGTVYIGLFAETVLDYSIAASVDYTSMVLQLGAEYQARPKTHSSRARDAPSLVRTRHPRAKGRGCRHPNSIFCAHGQAHARNANKHRCLCPFIRISAVEY